MQNCLSLFQVRTVFLDSLPPAWDEDHVKNHLRKFGRIEKVELARNMPAAKRTDFGFVTFDSHAAAVACVDGVNNAELVDGDRKVGCSLLFEVMSIVRSLSILVAFLFSWVVSHCRTCYVVLIM